SEESSQLTLPPYQGMPNAGDTVQSQPPDMTALKQEQAKHRGAITRAYNRCIAGDPFDYDTVNAAYKRLNDIEEMIFADGIPSSEDHKISDYTQKMIAIRKAKGILKDESNATKEPKTNWRVKRSPTPMARSRSGTSSKAS